MNRSDIGNMTYGLHDNTRDLISIWMMEPWRRQEYGRREIDEISEAVHGLYWLLREINKVEAVRQERAAKVSNGR